MAYQQAIPGATEFNFDTLATFIFAMGDSRYRTRALIPAQTYDPSIPGMRATTMDDVVQMGHSISAATESVLYAITVSGYWEDDESNIPNGDSGFEKTFKLLIRTKNNPSGKKETFQLRIPNVTAPFDYPAWLLAQGAGILTPQGGEVDRVVAVNEADDRRAGASV